MPVADRQSGRSTRGYRCNLELAAQFQDQGASWQNASYGDCDYYGTLLAGGQDSPGVQVIDGSTPGQPKRTANLNGTAMSSPWESLKVNEARGLLGGVQGGPAFGAAFFEVYDVRTDCRHPRLLNRLPLPTNLVGHEGTWAPDGLTYYVGSVVAFAAIDVSDTTSPRLIYADGSRVHGLSISADGNTAYFAMLSVLADEPNGLRVVDVSSIQRRDVIPQIHTISTLTWPDGGIAQSTIPISYRGRPYVVFTDEGGAAALSGGGTRGPAGGVRIIDISEPERPYTVSKMKLEIQLPENATAATADVQGNGTFGYQAHYCSVDREADPTALACGFMQSGIRVFDIRDVGTPREIAYFNPPAQTGQNARLKGSEHANNLVLPLVDAALFSDPGRNLTADWCSAQVRFYAPRNELWTQCQDNGFMMLRFSNRAYPLRRRSTSVPSRGRFVETVRTPAGLASLLSPVDGAVPALGPTLDTLAGNGLVNLDVKLASGNLTPGDRVALSFYCVLLPPPAPSS